MEITLYGPVSAPYLQKVALALAFKGLEFRLVEPSGPEDYRRWNPETGLLPVLEVDGERVADSTAILIWLDRRFPEKPLLSDNPTLATAQRSFMEWVEEAFMWYWRRWQRAQEERLARENRVDEAGSRDTARSAGASGPLRGLATRWFRGSGGEESAPRGNPEFESRLDELVRKLGDEPFFFGDRPSMADFGVYGMLYSMRFGDIPGAPRMLEERPALLEYMQRLEEAAERS